MTTAMSIDKALAIAVDAHSGQRDRGNTPYILHAIRVMMNVLCLGEAYAIVAVLHDVVEDSEVTLRDLDALGLSEEQLDALDRLTKRPGETRADNYQRVLLNPISRAVKIADTKDNLDLPRIKNRRNLQPKDMERINEYLSGLNLLEGN